MRNNPNSSIMHTLPANEMCDNLFVCRMYVLRNMNELHDRSEKRSVLLITFKRSRLLWQRKNEAFSPHMYDLAYANRTQYLFSMISSRIFKVCVKYARIQHVMLHALLFSIFLTHRSPTTDANQYEIKMDILLTRIAFEALSKLQMRVRRRRFWSHELPIGPIFG